MRDTDLSRAILAPGSRIGIANRGEAAVRFIRALNEFNVLYGARLTSTAFYLDIEREALFVRQADISCSLSAVSGCLDIGSEAYLNRELMIQALVSTDCQAVWSGWGFLAEDADFVEMVEKAGILFLGPASAPMRLLGNKIAAKEVAHHTGVPTVPWSEGSVCDLEHAREVAEKIGYPLIVKASGAGGGRGIRAVENPDDLSDSYCSAREETVRITGTSEVFIERMVKQARHLEVQVARDRYGNIKTFGVRDCSTQRRNQKIIEETPAPDLPAETASGMEEAANRLIDSVGYESLCTVEFIYDITTGDYYFMEVNTRLQVEHPITEQVYGIDLVKTQIKIAMGHRLDEESMARGVAIEARLNAEDPDRDFMPAPGEIVLYDLPTLPGIRVDSGVEQGCVIPSQFDSMIAKIIAYAPTRSEAIYRLEQALCQLALKIKGGTSNRAFLLEILRYPGFRNSRLSTGLVDRLLGDRERKKTTGNIALVACAIERYSKHYLRQLAEFNLQINYSGRPRNISPESPLQVDLNMDGCNYSFMVKTAGSNLFHLEIGGKMISARYFWETQGSSLVCSNNRYRIQMVPRGDALQCEVDGVPYSLHIESQDVVRALSPAMVISINATVGKSVDAGETLIILEAMKMEMAIVAPVSGKVKSISVKAGEQVAMGQVLVNLETDEKKQGVEPGKRVDFSRLVITDLSHRWKVLEREFLALFLGYDCDGTTKPLGRIQGFVAKHPGFKSRLDKCFAKAIEIYVALETMFSREQISAKGFAREATRQELLMHFFRGGMEAELELPRKFVDSFERAVNWYKWKGLSKEEGYRRALFRIYKSHGVLAAKQETLRSIFLSMEGQVNEHMADLFDEIAQLTQVQSPSLADAAINARYRLIDCILLQRQREQRRAKVGELLRLIARTENDRDKREDLLKDIVDSGHHIVVHLLQMALDAGGEKRDLALELLARRFNRDRETVSGHIEHISKELACYLLYSAKGKKNHLSLLAVADDENYRQAIESIGGYLQKSSFDIVPEFLMFVSAKAAKKTKIEEQAFDYLAKIEFTAWCTLGFFFSDGTFSYRTFNRKSGNWQEDQMRYSFSPLRFRELRVQRLENFELNILYRSESVHLLHLTAKNDPKDERLFALVEVPEAIPELTQDKGIHRIISFEDAIMEAIHAMRAEQARRRRRLFWNRIIVHVRSFLQVNLRQIRNYAAKLAPRAMKLGLEKLVLYTRSLDNEIEFLFENFSGLQFAMRHRIPSDKPYQPMNDYAAKVIRARQRNSVYPYEIVKMITRTGYPGMEKFPRGDFEEYDIEIGHAKEQEIISVKERAHGHNTCNIVFGIITNYVKHCPSGLKRVLLLSDPSLDMGALAEAECRRVIAALDLARQRGLPVEWIPISAGARIDMSSGTENLDWTARTLKRIIEFTQDGGEINVIVSGVNVGAQSYWNAEATMLMHTRGLLIMTDSAGMLLTGKKALDFSGSVSAEDNIAIGGVQRIMGPNGQAQIWTKTLSLAYKMLLCHYGFSYVEPGNTFPMRHTTEDPCDRDITLAPYDDYLEQGFSRIGDIFSTEHNPERKKPFDMRQIMHAVIDQDAGHCERWQIMADAETAIVWETRIGGFAVGLIGIESRPLTRLGPVPHDGPPMWSGGTLFPQSAKKVARAINSFSARLPVVVFANLSGFDGSPESLRKWQLEYGAEIGRAVVNFRGPMIFVVMARYHGGAYVVFSRTLNPLLKVAALKGTFASVIGGAPAAAVVFPRQVLKETWLEPRIIEAQKKLREDRDFSQKDFDEIFREIYAKKQTALGQKFDSIHSVERAREVGSVHDIINPQELRPYLVDTIARGMEKYSGNWEK